MTDESHIIQNCLDSAPGSWELMIDTYGNLVYSVPRNMGLDDDSAEDICQIVWTAVIRQLSQLDDRSRFRSWLLSITYRQSKGYLGRMLRERPVDIEEFARHPDLVDQDPGTRLEEELDRRHLVSICLESMEEPCLSLLRALYLEGEKSYRNISVNLSIPVGSIGPTRARCLEKLRASLRKRGIHGRNE